MIYLIRHGQTVLNREGRYQGRIDSPLTELGVAQAEAIGRRLAELKAQLGGRWRIEASTQGRAMATARIIAASLVLPEPEPDERLVEASYGELEGLTRPEVDARWPEFVGLRGTFGRAPGGEPMDELVARAGAWLAEHPDGPGHCVAVSHASTGRVLRGLYLGLGVEETRLLETPQHAFHLLAEGRVARIEVDALPSPPAGS
jgi:broad specificity phosphatase PhoE